MIWFELRKFICDSVYNPIALNITAKAETVIDAILTICSESAAIINDYRCGGLGCFLAYAT